MSYPVIPTDDDRAHFASVSQEHATAGGWHAQWRKRVTTERMIVRKAVRDAIAAGYVVSLDYGEGDVEVRRSADVKPIMRNLMACDEEWLHFHKDGKYVGTLALIYDNGDGGATVISDYHTSLEPILAGANELAEKLSS